MTGVRFLKVRFDPMNVDEAVAQVSARAEGLAPFAYVVTPNAQGIVRRNAGTMPQADAAFEAAWLSTNDSGPAQFLAKALFGLRLGRVAGSDLTTALLERNIRPETPITILGGTEQLQERLQEIYGLRCVRRMNPAMGMLEKPEEIERSARFIIDNPAPYIFLVVGTPQAELVAHRVLQLGGGRGVGLCVGSALNFATGLSVRAPVWMRACGLEWLHRLLAAPRTHANRVFVQSFPLLWLALAARLGRRPA
jgi:exopolysaccharide biosynthesis WecB/TagA/CpsF family protein